MRKKLLFTLALLVLVVSVVAVDFQGKEATQAQAATTTPSKSSIKLGFSMSSSGPFAYGSQRLMRGFKIWEEEVNARGGIFVKDLGATLPVEFVFYDDRSDKEIVPRMYEKLIVEDKVDILIAPYSSTQTLAAAPITEKHKKLLMINTASSTQVYNKGFKLIVSITTINTEITIPSLDYIAEVLKPKTIAIIYSDTVFTTDWAEQTRLQAPARGMEVVQFDKYPPNTKDFTIMLQRAASLKPDIFMVLDFVGGLINAVTQQKQLGIDFPAVYSQHVVHDEFAEALGDDSAYFLGASQWHPELMYRVNVGYDNAAYLKSYKALYPGEVPQYLGVSGYSCVAILEKMIEKAGSLNAQLLRQAANELSGKLTHLSGKFLIDADTGTGHLDYVPMQRVPDPATGGTRLVILGPSSVATGSVVHPMPTWNERK
jgi:branched-chain amino acid transport system substrate-binding protein